jgi:NAD(P)-dependent dehydrogenase (short-subunit alcohol dehydrogenase family)
MRQFAPLSAYRSAYLTKERIMAAWTADNIPTQHGKVAVVTGANSGLGLVTATQLATHGAHVLLAVRNTAAGERAAAAIRAAVPQAKLEVHRLDLASLASVEAFADTVTAAVPAIDLLVNNAGMMMLGKRRTTADGFESHLGTNMLGHYALTGLLLDSLTRAQAARVISLSSITHKNAHLDFDDLMSERNYDASRAYGRSKLATTLFGLELDRRLRASSSPVRSMLAHPGISRTNFTPHAWESYGRMGQIIARVFMLALTPIERGVLPQLYAATAPNVQGGQFFGPSGFREIRGAVTEVRPSTEAADPSVAQRLWAAAQELTGVKYIQSPE